MIEIDIAKELYGAEGAMDFHLALSIEEGEFLAIYGKSGSGKTTLLRTLAGLEEAEGEIVVDGECWLSKDTTLPTQSRGIGFVFQDYALFENMTVEQNLLFVKKERALVEHLLALTELTALKNRYPKSLSGGQKQRVSIARALMNRPKLLLLDEPLSALDSLMRTKLQNELLALHKEFGTTTIMVTHSMDEIHRVASRVIELENGKIIQDTTPEKLLRKNESSGNLSFEGEILTIDEVDGHYRARVNQSSKSITLVAKELDYISQTKNSKLTHKRNYTR